MKRRKPELMEGLETIDDSMKVLEEAVERLLRALEMAERNERWASGKSSLMAEREQLDRHMMIAGSLSDKNRSVVLTPSRLRESNTQTSATK